VSSEHRKEESDVHPPASAATKKVAISLQLRAIETPTTDRPYRKTARRGIVGPQRCEQV